MAWGSRDEVYVRSQVTGPIPCRYHRKVWQYQMLYMMVRTRVSRVDIDVRRL
jgi:hypothetical protein